MSWKLPQDFLFFNANDDDDDIRGVSGDGARHGSEKMATDEHV
jgi:hypothetical protein